MAPLVVDNEDKLRLLLTHIAKRTSEEHLVFVDIEGVDLSRNGIIAVMQLLVPPDPTVYLVDLHILGSEAFDLTTNAGTSLKSVLESKDIFKVFFDIRNDSDALHAHFGIEVAGIIDLQVIEYATRQPRGRYLNGLARCIERDLSYVPGWLVKKANGRRLFRPEEGGKYEVFLERPISDGIAGYCEQDVLLMPQLLACYGPRLQPGVAAQLQAIVDERIRLSKSATYNGKGRHMALGPYIGPASIHANKGISPEIDLVCSPHLHRLCRLDDSLVASLVPDLKTMDLEQKLSTPSDDKSSSTKGATSRSTATESATTVSTTPPIASGPIATAVSMMQVQEDSSEDEQYISYNSYSRYDSDNDSDRDFTACSADDCGYCGKCMY